jgi:hypothetical protein
MASVCRIPSEHSIYDVLRIALNEQRIWDAILIYSQMSPEHQIQLASKYPEIYWNYVGASTEFLR